MNSSLFQNLGGIALAVIGVVILVIFVVIMKMVCRHQKIQTVLQKVKKILIWNFIIRYFYASYLNFLFGALATLTNPQSLTEDKIVSGVIVFVLIVTNILFVIKLYSTHHRALEHPI